MSARLYRKCRRKDIVPARLAEVGVYYPETSNILGFIRDGIPCMLVEADPVCVEKIREFFKEYPGVEIFHCAIWDRSGRVSLYRANSSTFIGSLDGSPAEVNDTYVRNEADRFEVDALRFSEIDPGDIDLLSIDIEGAEWHVLNHLRSRPRIITLETHAAQYLNPSLDRIEQWMRDNGYRRWFMDDTDSVFARIDGVSFGAFERATDGMGNAWILFRHRLKGLKRRIRKRLRG